MPLLQNRLCSLMFIQHFCAATYTTGFQLLRWAVIMGKPSKIDCTVMHSVEKLHMIVIETCATTFSFVDSMKMNSIRHGCRAKSGRHSYRNDEKWKYIPWSMWELSSVNLDSNMNLLNFESELCWDVPMS